ncbi:hypothetical protein IFM89_012981 [Coptis chinensis]|uniref:Phosphotransferase n=1 Tax=Coptis chinensis TaxID=261450 RepID=A0A835J023_9MAGN|nr:hypothetical protein IFM89_012981 [Coptis chinensis]
MAILKEFEDMCDTPLGKLKQVAEAMTVEMHAGLASEGGSTLGMLISSVDNLPTGMSTDYSMHWTLVEQNSAFHVYNWVERKDAFSSKNLLKCQYLLI